MSRSKRKSLSAPPIIDSEYWLRFGEDPEPSTRDKLLYVTIGEISRRGILDVNSRWVCDLLDVKYALVNYYFGSFDGLLAEAIAWCYREWQQWLIASVSKKAKSPRERLRNVLIGEINRHKHLGSVVVFSAYPYLSETVTTILRTKHQVLMEDATEYYLEIIAKLIRDIATGSISSTEDIVTPVGGAMFKLGYRKELLASASVGWSITGLAMWSSEDIIGTGRAQATAGSLMTKQAINSHLDRILDSLEAEFVHN